MSRIRILCHLVTNLLFTLSWAYKEPGVVVDPSTFQRTNLCGRTLNVINGSIPLAQALVGAVVTVAVNYDTSSVYFKFNNRTGTVTGGLIFEIQKAMAQAGGFKWQYNMVADPVGKSGNGYMLSTLGHFDILGVYYTDTTTRRNAGIGFTQVIKIISYVLIFIIFGVL